MVELFELIDGQGVLVDEVVMFVVGMVRRFAFAIRFRFTSGIVIVVVAVVAVVVDVAVGENRRVGVVGESRTEKSFIESGIVVEI